MLRTIEIINAYAGPFLLGGAVALTAVGVIWWIFHVVRGESAPAAVPQPTGETYEPKHDSDVPF